MSPGDRTPCVVVDCDGEDLRKSRFAVQLRRPSFSSLLLDAWAAFALKSPLFPFLTQLNRAAESLERAKAISELENTPVSYERGRLAARFSVVHRAYRDAAQGQKEKRWRSGRSAQSEKKNPKPLPMKCELGY